MPVCPISSASFRQMVKVIAILAVALLAIAASARWQSVCIDSERTLSLSA